MGVSRVGPCSRGPGKPAGVLGCAAGSRESAHGCPGEGASCPPLSTCFPGLHA